jgi:hypothetical protein
MAMLSIESSGVIWLRSLKLTLGGPSAIIEAALIVSEKTIATGELPMHLANGKTPLAMTVAYRRAVRANLNRLRR